MFHGEGCLNNVLHFFIVPVSLHFCSMTSITSWCPNVMIEWALLVTGGALWHSLSKWRHYVNKDAICYTFGTTGICLSPCLAKITGLKKWHYQFTIKDTWFGLMDTFTFLTGAQYDSSSHTHHQQQPGYNYHHHCPWLNWLMRTHCTGRIEGNCKTT